MIIKGNPGGNVVFWSKHLLRDDTNERAQVVEISGLLSEDLPAALREMQAIAAQSRSEGNFLYQANINPRDDEHLTAEQWREAVDTLEKNLGLEGHQRVVIEHEKEGRVHRHVVWNRVDVETLKVADMTGNWRVHTATARELEQRFDLTPTPSTTALNRSPAFELWEIRAAERSGISPEEVRFDLTTAWYKTDTGQEFAAAIEKQGYTLVQGDRRDFCVIDMSGDVHSLARRIDGAKAKDIRERMADVDRESLPTVASARVTQWQMQRERTATESKINTLQTEAVSPGAFAAALYREGITIARVDRAGIDNLTAEQQAAFQQDKWKWSPELTEGELVAVNRAGDVNRLNPYKVDLPLIEEALTTGKKTIPALGSIREMIVGDHAADQAQAAERQEKWNARRAEFEDRQQLSHRRNADAGRARITDANIRDGMRDAPLAVVDVASGVSEKLVDFVAGLLGGGSEKKTPTTPESEQLQQIKANRRALAAIENIRDSMDRGENLRPSDIAALTPTHLENIKRLGDAYIMELVERAERSRELYTDYGRTRER